MSSLAEQITIGEQAFLLLHLRDILNATRNTNVVGGSTVDYDRTKVEYSNFSCLRSGEPGHFNLTKNFTKNVNMTDIINKLPPQFLNALLPSIKLYKVFHTPKTDQKTSVGPKALNEYEWRIPFDSTFTNHNPYTSEFVAESIQNVLEGKGRMNGAGIRSFRYEYLGTNPADIVTNIKAELEIYFQSVEDLVTKIQIFPDDSRYINKKPTEMFDFSYADLVGVSLGSIKSTNANQLAPSSMQSVEHTYRIRAEIGYANLDDNYYNRLGEYFSNIGLDAKSKKEQILNIKEAINNTKVILMLTATSHDIKFNEDGTTTLKIEYFATLDSVLYSSETDILRMGNEHEKIIQARRALNQLLLDREKQIDKIKTDQCLDEKEIEKQIEALYNSDRRFSTLSLQDRREALYNQEAKYYDRFYRSLIGIENNNKLKRRFVNNSSLPYGIYKISYDLEEIGIDNITKPGTDPSKIFEKEFTDSEAIGKRLNFLTKKINTTRTVSFTNSSILPNNYSFVPNSNELTSFLKKNTSIFERIINLFKNEKEFPDEEQINKGLEEYYNNKLEEISKPITQAVSSHGNIAYKVIDKNREIQFVFLGDILDCALENVFNDFSINNYIKIKKFISVVGDIKLTLPTGQDQKIVQKLGDLSPFATKKEQIVNLADIPISLHLLQHFLFEKIVKPRRETYPVGLFIKDIISDLIFPALSPTYLAKNITENTHIKFSSFYLTLPIDKSNKDPILQKDPSDQSPLPSITKQYIDSIAKGKYSINKSLIQSIDSMNYYFIYCSSQFNTSDLNGIEVDDNSKGIFHLRMGAQSGIVKSINFSKTDTPFYREALAHQEGMTNVHLLRQVYDAEIKMFGNDIYKPGDTLYIEPIFTFGRNDGYKSTIKNFQKKDVTKELNLSILNIDGYYMVNKVTSTINDNIYETRLNCIKKAFRTNKDGKPEVIQVNDPCRNL